MKLGARVRRVVLAAIIVGTSLTGTVVAHAGIQGTSPDDPQADVNLVMNDDGVLQIAGWAFDRNSFGWSVDVRLSVDGIARSSVRAELPSDYLYAYGVPGRHGFWTAVAMAPGDHLVCVTWGNVGPGAPIQECRSVKAPPRAAATWPQGDVTVSVDDAAGGATVMGWAFDHSQLATSIDVEVYVDGIERGRWLAASASDYLFAYGVPGRHGYVGFVALTAGDHEICVLAIDRAPGADVALGCRTVTANPVLYSPEGDIAISMNANGSLSVRGWAFDRSDLGTPIQVAVFQNGSLTAAPFANGPSPELAAYGLPSRGIDLRLPPVSRNTPVEACVIGLNVGSGENRWLRCVSVDPRGTRAVADRASASSLTVLVNKRTPLSPRQYTPSLWPLSVVGVSGGQAMRPEAAVAMRDLVVAAGKQGIGLQVGSGYRSYDTQVAVFDRYVRERGVAAAELTSARPSYSEHQTGLAADVTAPAEGCAIAQCFGGTRAGRWVADNAWRFGFIVRYPNGYTSITGYEWEPWHVRYVGTDVSREMHDGGVPTYEQYLGAAAAPTY